MNMEKIIALCGSEPEGKFYKDTLSSEFQVEIYFTAKEAQGALSDPTVAVAIANCGLDRIDGIGFLKEALRIDPTIVRIAFSEQQEFKIAASVVNEAHVHNYLCGELDSSQLKSAIEAGLRSRSKEKAVDSIIETLRKEKDQLDETTLEILETLKNNKK